MNKRFSNSKDSDVDFREGCQLIGTSDWLSPVDISSILIHLIKGVISGLRHPSKTCGILSVRSP